MLVGLSDSKNNAITIVEILAIMMLAGVDYQFISTKIKHEALVHQQPQIQVQSNLHVFHVKLLFRWSGSLPCIMIVITITIIASPKCKCKFVLYQYVRIKFLFVLISQNIVWV